jgi:hypothetical protein
MKALLVAILLCSTALSAPSYKLQAVGEINPYEFGLSGAAKVCNNKYGNIIAAGELSLFRTSAVLIDGRIGYGYSFGINEKINIEPEIYVGYCGLSMVASTEWNMNEQIKINAIYGWRNQLAFIGSIGFRVFQRENDSYYPYYSYPLSLGIIYSINK